MPARTRAIAGTLLLTLLLTLLAGCRGDNGGGPRCEGHGSRTTRPASPRRPRSATSRPPSTRPTSPVDITHEFWPMRPGTRWTYRESGEDEELTVEVTATSVTREIVTSITARVVRDTVSEDGVVVEDTFDWYAQDRTGTSGTSARTPPSSRTASWPPARAPSRPASTARCPASPCPVRRSPASSTGRSTSPARPRTTARSWPGRHRFCPGR